MSDMTIRAHTPEDDPAIVAILSRLSPEVPAPTVEQLQAGRETFSPVSWILELMAEIDGTLVGHGRLMGQPSSGKPASFTLNVRVDPAYWGQGVGSALYGRLLEQAREWNAGRLFVMAREDRLHALQFAARRGFKETGHVMRMSRLDVLEVNLTGYDGLEERLRAEGIQVASLAELGPDDEDFLRALHEVQMTGAQDEPRQEPLVIIPFDQWLTGILNQPGVSRETVWAALAGNQPIGVAMLERSGDDAGSHFGLVVAREYRGRGIARLLKLRQIEWAQKAGVRYLFTGNDINNPGIYDINVRLGYQPLPAGIGLVKELQEG